MDPTLQEAALTSTRDQLITELSQDSRFAWLQTIAKQSTEAALSEAISDPAELPERFSPFAIHRNISLANDIANRCLAKRDQIIDLETKALSSAIALKEDLAAIETNLRLAKARLRGTAVQLSSDELNNSLVDLEEQHRASEASIRHRMELHSLRSSPLNYGEQLVFQRQIQIENCQTLLELLTSIHTGLVTCYPTIRETIEPPLYPYKPHETLPSWVMWLRLAIRTVESLEYQEQVRTVHLPLLRIANMQGVEFNAFYTSLLLHGRIQVNLTREAFALGGVSLTPDERPRLLGVGVAIVPLTFQWLRSDQTNEAFANNVMLQNVMTDVAQLKFPCQTTAPDQAVGTPTSTLDLGLLSVSDPGLGVSTLIPQAAGPLEYFNPLGEWEVYLGPDIRLLQSRAFPDGQIGLGDLHAALADVPNLGIQRFELFLNLTVSV